MIVIDPRDQPSCRTPLIHRVDSRRMVPYRNQISRILVLRSPVTQEYYMRRDYPGLLLEE